MMSDELRLAVEERPNRADVQCLIDGLNEHARQFADVGYSGDLGIFLRDRDGTVVGGLDGVIWSGWLSVRFLWVKEELRGQGWGRTIMLTAEREALGKGCRHVRLDTMSYQARGFYEKLGFRLFAQLGDYPGPHNMYFLVKDLT